MCNQLVYNFADGPTNCRKSLNLAAFGAGLLGAVTEGLGGFLGPRLQHGEQDILFTMYELCAC